MVAGTTVVFGSVRLADAVTRHTRDPSFLPPHYEKLSITSAAKSTFNFHSWNSTTHALWPTTLWTPPPPASAVRRPPHKASLCPHSHSWCWPPGLTAPQLHADCLLAKAPQSQKSTWRAQTSTKRLPPPHIVIYTQYANPQHRQHWPFFNMRQKNWFQF